MTSRRLYVFLAASCVAWAVAGCGFGTFSAPDASSAEFFLAIEVADFGGARALAARIDAVTSESVTVSLPDDMMRDAPDQAAIVLTPADIAVTFAGETAKRINRNAKGGTGHASVGFRLARAGDNPCASEDEVGPFEVNFSDGVVTLSDESLPVPADAIEILRGGRFAICIEVWADFDGSIALGVVSIEFGGSRDRVERVAVCHVPGEGSDDAHTIVVGAPAVDAHLAHGDYLGDCEDRDENDMSDGGSEGGGDAWNGDDGGDDADNEGDGDSENGDDSEADDDDADTDTDDGDDADPENDDPTYVNPDDIINVESAVCDDTTDHCYIFVDDPLWWDDAAARAERMVYAGMTGHLATVTGDAENSFLKENFGRPGMLGGTDAETEGVWRWAAGPEAGQDITYLPWADGEPNNLTHWTYPTGEHYLQLEVRGFNDINGARWYYVEFEATDSDGDGVLDAGDKCSDTPPGETVDTAGCSCSQKDADSDGVDNCADICASTSAGLSVNAAGCATNQIDDDNDGVMNDADACENSVAGTTVDANGCSCSQLDADSDGVDDCDDLCAQTPAGETSDTGGCSTSQLTTTVTVPGPTDIYLSGQPDGTTATWSLTGSTSVAPQHSPKMIDVSAWAGKELRFTATGVVVTGGNNAATPDGRNWVLRPNGLSQVFGLTAMRDYKEGALVGVFLTAALPTSGLLPYMSSSGITTTTPLLQHIFVIGSSSQVVIPKGATRLFFGVAEQQGLITNNSGSFDLTVEAVPHTLLPSDPLSATRFYVGDPNDPKDGIGWFDDGQWAFDYDFDGVADFTTTFGQAGDQPVVGDWNGDGLDEIGVMTPSASGNAWMLDTNGNGVFDSGDATFTYGADAGAIAITGDWDGDGISELGFTTPDNLWHLDLNGDRVDGAGEALDTQFNRSIPVIGDWTGDGVSNLGNMNNGSVGWQFDLDNDRRWIWGTTYRDQNWSWGNSGMDTGVVGDWDGDGLEDPARYRASTGDWHFTTRVGKGVLVAPSVIGFGANATPVAGSWASIRAVDVD